MIRDYYAGSPITDQDIFPSRIPEPIPDQEVKIALDPGSGSATVHNVSLIRSITFGVSVEGHLY
jgi:hypothetical protein